MMVCACAVGEIFEIPALRGQILTEECFWFQIPRVKCIGKVPGGSHLCHTEYQDDPLMLICTNGAISCLLSRRAGHILGGEQRLYCVRKARRQVRVRFYLD
jgi:hypothetical protein